VGNRKSRPEGRPSRDLQLTKAETSKVIMTAKADSKFKKYHKHTNSKNQEEEREWQEQETAGTRETLRSIYPAKTKQTF